MIKRLKDFLWSLFEPRKVLTPVEIPVLQSKLLEGQCALITGGTSGIGLTIARSFLDAGARVIITGRNRDRIDKAIELLNSCKASGIVLDNTKVESFGETFANCVNTTGAPTILVNNAGALCDEQFGATTFQTYNTILDTNLKGAYFLSQVVSQYWIKHNIHGNILNVGSSSSLRPGNSPYILSKVAIKSLTAGLARSLIKYNIVVNGIAPGPTSTKKFFGNGTNGLNWPANPSGRLVTENEIANLAVILVSKLSRMVVGDMLFVTGGAGTVTIDDVES